MMDYYYTIVELHSDHQRSTSLFYMGKMSSGNGQSRQLNCWKRKGRAPNDDPPFLLFVIWTHHANQRQGYFLLIGSLWHLSDERGQQLDFTDRAIGKAKLMGKGDNWPSFPVAKRVRRISYVMRLGRVGTMRIAQGNEARLVKGPPAGWQRLVANFTPDPAIVPHLVGNIIDQPSAGRAAVSSPFPLWSSH